jgi:prepilin-type N-terminal cleavage/methylation domain-containing protein
MTSGNIRAGSQAGYNIIELMFVLGIMGVIAAMAVAQIGAARPGLKGDGAMRVVMGQMNAAREMAIAQRKYMRVTFTQPACSAGVVCIHSVGIIREETPLVTTTLSTIPIEGGVQFVLVNGLPDTPDGFGKAAAVDFGAAANVKFTPDGTMVNQDGAGSNGTVFLAIPNLSMSARAITVLGSTGRVRAYKWDGKQWKLG